MGISKVIDQGRVEVDKKFEQGFGVYDLVSGENCGSGNIFLGLTIMNPASRNQAHVHLNCEVMWFLAAGHTMHYSETVEHEEYTEHECFPGTVGYVGKNELHVGKNLNNEMIGQVIFTYAGVNQKEDAGTVFYEDVNIVREYMEERGKRLEDVL